MARRKMDGLLDLLSDLKSTQTDIERRVRALETKKLGLPWRALLPYFYGAAGLAFGVMVAAGKVPPSVIASLLKGSSH